MEFPQSQCIWFEGACSPRLIKLMPSPTPRDLNAPCACMLWTQAKSVLSLEYICCGCGLRHLTVCLPRQFCPGIEVWYHSNAGLSEAMLGSGPWQLGEMGQKYMKTIKTSSLHLSALINDILDAAAATKGKLAIKLEKVRPMLQTQAQHADSLLRTCILLTPHQSGGRLGDLFAFKS